MVGDLSKKQLLALVEALPLDISFIDEKDVLVFWNKHEVRPGKRPVSLLGTKIQDCHPRKSRERLDRMLSDFIAGKLDKVEYHIDLKGSLKGKRAYRAYIAVRDSAGRYLGTIQLTHDIERVQRLGEKEEYWEPQS